MTRGVRAKRRYNAKRLEIAECAVANISNMGNIRKDVSEIKDVCQAESIKKDDRILQQEEEILEAKVKTILHDKWHDANEEMVNKYQSPWEDLQMFQLKT